MWCHFMLSSTTQHYEGTTKYYSVLQSTTPVLQSTTLYYKVLLRATKYYSSTTKYYSSTTKYYSVQQSTTPVQLRTTPVLQSTTPVLLRTTKYYASTTLYYKVLLQYYKVLRQHKSVLLQYYKVLLQYYSVLQSTTPVLQSTTPYYKVPIQYYKVLLQYYKVLLRTTKYYASTTKYYSVLQATTPVLLCTTPVLQSTTPHYKVLRQYYGVLLQVVRLPQKVAFELHQILRLSSKMTPMLDPGHIWNVIYNARSNKCHPPTSPNTAPATQNDSHAWSSSHMKRHLQCAEQQVSPSNLTKYCACHTEWLACLIVVTYETSFTMCGATGVTIQPHQILRLPHRMTRMLDRRHIWNVIYNARSNRCHHPTSPNTAPATKNNTATCQRKFPKTDQTSFPMRGRSDHDPNMKPSDRNPPRNRGYFSSPPRAFSIEKYNVLRPILHSNIHQVLRLPRKVTLEPHQILRLSSKMTPMLDPGHIWNVIYNARSNKCHPPTSPNTAPATQNDSHAWSSSHMKRHLQCAEQQVSPSNLTKYCACHTEWLACLIVVTYETSFTMRGATGVTIQPHQILRLPRKITLQHFCENFRKRMKRHFQCGADPTMIRPWNRQSATRLATEVTFRAHHEHFLLKNTTFCAQSYTPTFTKYCACHEKWHLNFTKVLHLPRKVTLELHQVLHLPRKVTLELHQVLHLPRKATLELHQVLHLSRKVTLELDQALRLPRKVTLEPHQILRLSRKWLPCLILVTYETSFTMRGATGVTIQPHQILRLPHRMTRMLDRRHIWNVIYNARSNRCHHPTSPNTAPATKNNTATFLRKFPKTDETSFPMRGRSDHDPTMNPSVRNPPRNRGYFSSPPRAFSIEKYNVLRPILHSNIHQVLRLPRKVTLEPHQVLHLPRKVTLELHQVLHLPRKVTLELHQVLHLSRKVTLELHQVLHLSRKVTLELDQILHLSRKVTLERHQHYLHSTTKSGTWTSPNTAPATKSLHLNLTKL